MATKETKDNMALITGNTYPVKDQLKALGGQWQADVKAWEVPDDKAETARKLVASAPAPAKKSSRSTSGRCYACGEKCKYPYTECLDCREERMMGY